MCLYNYCNSVAIFVEIVIAKVTDGFCVYKYCIYTCGTCTEQTALIRALEMRLQLL